MHGFLFSSHMKTTPAVRITKQRETMTVVYAYVSTAIHNRSLLPHNGQSPICRINSHVRTFLRANTFDSTLEVA